MVGAHRSAEGATVGVHDPPRRSRTTIPVVHFVYIVRCADGTLYTGYARDPTTRVKVHNAGRGARYTAGRRPVRLIYSESFESVGDALRREYALKRRSRAQKEALVKRRRPSLAKKPGRRQSN
jgi:putative endonuclease